MLSIEIHFSLHGMSKVYLIRVYVSCVDNIPQHVI